jgi:phospholipase C
VPTVLVSPLIQAGTVFRSNTATPYDHTSILATLRDWLGIADADMLPSRRVAAAPNLAQVLTLTVSRKDMPVITPPEITTAQTPLIPPLNDLQRALVAGTALRFGMDVPTVMAQIKTHQDAVDFFKRRISAAGL